MRFEYRNNHYSRKPALVLDVQVLEAGLRKKVEATAMLDTGADITAIPLTIARELDLRPRGSRRVSFPTVIKPVEAPSFYVSIQITPDISIEALVVALDIDLIYIGRDILNQLVLKAYGPEGRFELNR